MNKLIAFPGEGALWQPARSAGIQDQIVHLTAAAVGVKPYRGPVRPEMGVQRGVLGQHRPGIHRLPVLGSGVPAGEEASGSGGLGKFPQGCSLFHSAGGLGAGAPVGVKGDGERPLPVGIQGRSKPGVLRSKEDKRGHLGAAAGGGVPAGEGPFPLSLPQGVGEQIKSCPPGGFIIAIVVVLSYGTDP